MSSAEPDLPFHWVTQSRVGLRPEVGFRMFLRTRRHYLPWANTRAGYAGCPTLPKLFVLAGVYVGTYPDRRIAHSSRVGSWGGQRPSMEGFVTGMGPRTGRSPLEGAQVAHALRA